MGLLGDALSFDKMSDTKRIFSKLTKSTAGLTIKLLKNSKDYCVVLTDRVNNVKVTSEKDYWEISFSLSPEIYKEMLSRSQDFYKDRLISVIEYSFEDRLIDKQFVYNTTVVTENSKFVYRFLR